MRTNFSPTALAAQRHASRPPMPVPAAPVTPAAEGERWCEWPRRVQSLPPFRSIRQALAQIQAMQTRHA